MIKFEKPNFKITDYVEKKNYGRFEIEPLERGFGYTIGNALRRAMLSSLPGSAITSVKIDGVLHEFQTIEGVVEDVTSIVLNLKSVVLKKYTEEEKVITISKNTPGVVTAGDIMCDADVEIINKDHVIATIAEGGSLEMEMTVATGRGYVRSDENKKALEDKKVGIIAIDSIYSPIEKVAYDVEKTRVGQDESYDKLIIEVWTNSAMKPEEALSLASRIVIEHLEIIANLDNIADVSGIMVEKEEDPKAKALETPIEDLEFSVRAHNCLKNASIHTIQDLVDKSESEIMKIRNLGKKSLKEVLDKIKELDLDLKEDE